VAEVVASLLDSTKCLADGTVRDLVVGVDELIRLRVALAHCVVLAARGQGDILGEGGGVGQGGHSQQRNQPQHIWGERTLGDMGRYGDIWSLLTLC